MNQTIVRTSSLWDFSRWAAWSAPGSTTHALSGVPKRVNNFVSAASGTCGSRSPCTSRTGAWSCAGRKALNWCSDCQSTRIGSVASAAPTKAFTVAPVYASRVMKSDAAASALFPSRAGSAQVQGKDVDARLGQRVHEGAALALDLQIEVRQAAPGSAMNQNDRRARLRRPLLPHGHVMTVDDDVVPDRRRRRQEQKRTQHRARSSEHYHLPCSRRMPARSASMVAGEATKSSSGKRRA